MEKIFSESNVAIIGGGRVCKAILKIVLDPSFDRKKSTILGIADIDNTAEGFRYAREKGIFTTTDYRELFQFQQLDTIVEIVGDNNLLQKLKRNKPHGVRLIDHFEAMSLWDFLQIEEKKRGIQDHLQVNVRDTYALENGVCDEIEREFQQFSYELANIVSERTRHLQLVEKNLVRRDQTISQVIQGSTIPTFVIDKNHVVTHWNKALERITGIRAHDIVGTKDHWKAFYAEKRPCMADHIVDGIKEEEIRKYHGERSRRSPLMKGAYEAEGFFPDLGESGKWLYFTAAPIRGLNGKIVGSIETLWDNTTEKEAQHKLEELEALEASILDAIHIAVLVLRERRIIFANGAVESVFGWKPEEVIGKSTRIVYRSEEEYEEIGRMFYDALRKQRTYSCEFQCTREDGREIMCMVRTSRIGERLEERAIVATYEDITEQKEAERERIHREKILAQTIQGSTIPTFVIDKDHVVTHWNKALERLTGNQANNIVGTKRQWTSFYAEEKPIMADLIVDQMQEEDIKKYYGIKGRKSRLIEGAYEAEDFFPHIGERGRWLYFTAAPIKGADGSIIGAIETLWDTTDTKLLQDERVKHIRQLSSLWKITSALSEKLELDETLSAAVNGTIENLDVDSVVIYLKDDDSDFRVACSAGHHENLYRIGSKPEPDSAIDKVARNRTKIILEDVSAGSVTYTECIADKDLKSAAYIPLTSKGGVFGVIGISSHTSDRFAEDDKNLLAIISNRIAVAIENARLHQETKKIGEYLEVKVHEKTAKLEETYKEIQRSEEKYRTMFDADPNPIIIADRETFRIQDVNATAVECYGYSRSEFLAMSFVGLGYQPDHELIEGVKKISLHQSTFYPKRIHKKKSGKPFYVNVHIRSVRFMGGNSLIATTPDVTENVEQEAQLIQASKMATLGTMASGIAHEINQPLNVIQVCSDYFKKMIARGKIIQDEDLYAMAEEIEQNVQRAAQTITHMRDFSRQSEVKNDRLDINQPIVDVFKILGQQLRVHKIDVTMDLADNLPPIVADHNRLEQVFINLVTNARDALDEKDEQLGNREWDKVLKITSYRENDQVIVSVHDNGSGVPEEIREKIFEPFFTTKDVGKGTGLGMSISYGIIKDYGGTIDVESNPDNGTTFTLAFPASDQDEQI